MRPEFVEKYAVNQNTQKNFPDPDCIYQGLFP